MGLDLLSLAIVKYAHLPARPYKVLMKICRIALDKPNAKGQPERLYYAGWEPLAMAMGFDVPPDTDDAKAKARRRKLSDYATDALNVLEKEGAIRRLVDHPRTGYRQTVQVLLGDPISPPESGGQEPPGFWGPDAPDSGGQEPPGFRGISPPDSGGPRKDEGPIGRGLISGQTTPRPAQPPVATGEVADDIDSSTRAEAMAELEQLRLRWRGAS